MSRNINGTFIHLHVLKVTTFSNIINYHIISLGNAKIRIRRGRKSKDDESSTTIKDVQNTDINKNYIHENEIYEQVDPNNDPDILQLRKEKKDFFERLKCRFGIPFPLTTETHFRTYKEARILTRGDRDIIIKRLTEQVRLIQSVYIQFNM